MIWTVCGLLLAVLLFIMDFSRSQAAAVTVKEGNTDGVLQEGNLLPEGKAEPNGYAFGAGDSSAASSSPSAEKEQFPNGGLPDANGGLLPFGSLGADRNPAISLQGASAANREKAKKAMEAAVKNFKSELNVSAYNLTVSEMSSLYTDLINGHPEFFYLRSYAYTYNGAGQVLQVNFFYTSADLADLKKVSAAYESKVKEILACINPTWSDLEKALYVNDYLAINCQYDNRLTRFTAYNAIVDGISVCQGYALAFLDLMNRLDIPCEVVSSRTLNHAWNLVKIGKAWYHVDVTWNDPVPDLYGRAAHTYFLKSSAWFNSPSISGVESHYATDLTYSGSAGSAQASNTAFDNALWNSVDSPFGYYKGYWYGNENGTIHQYSAGSSGLKKVKEIRKLTDVWHLWGSAAYYTSSFSGCAVLGNKLYYAAPNQIRSLNLAAPKEEPTVVYELTKNEKKQGNIFGIYLTGDGMLRYAVGKAPNQITMRMQRNIHTHSFGAWKTTKKSTCTKGGVATRTCSCGMEQTKVIAATGHKHTEKSVTKATFVKNGTEKTICKDCKKTIKTKKLPKAVCKKGKTYTVGNYKYRIISPKINGKGTVSFIGLVKNAKKVTIGDTVTILGAKFKIVQIGDRALENRTTLTSVTIGKNVQTIGKQAFAGTRKLTSVTIRSEKLKKVGTNALKGIHAKAVIQVPKEKVKEYQKLLKGKGQKKTVKVRS